MIGASRTCASSAPPWCAARGDHRYRKASVEAARLRETDLHGCTVDDLRGALSLRGARISPDQIVPLAAVLLDELGIQVTEQPPRSG